MDGAYVLANLCELTAERAIKLFVLIYNLFNQRNQILNLTMWFLARFYDILCFYLFIELWLRGHRHHHNLIFFF